MFFLHIRLSSIIYINDKLIQLIYFFPVLEPTLVFYYKILWEIIVNNITTRITHYTSISKRHRFVLKLLLTYIPFLLLNILLLKITYYIIKPSTSDEHG